MKKLLASILATSIWYGVFSFITMDFNFENWHWGARLVFLILTGSSINTILKENNSN